MITSRNIEYDLSIIIVSYNTKKLLKECITSVRESIEHLAYELIVVDNNSHDGSPEMVMSEFKEVHLINNHENVGFAKANNQGIALASGRYVLLLNSDTLVPYGTFETLITFMDGQPKAAIVGPKVLNFDGTLQNKGFFFPSIGYSILTLLKLHRLLPSGVLSKIFRHYYWDENDVRPVDWVSGCCFLIRTKVIRTIGLLSEDFFMYGEELEFCFRAKQKLYEVWYMPLVTIKHLNQGSECKDRSALFMQAKKRLYEKIFGVNKGNLITIITLLSL